MLTKKPMNPKISVIIAAYNSEKYLEECLKSIFNQTFKDYEVIVCNDGSTDSTRHICELYASKHDNMILINLEKNEGVAVARNNGLKACKGMYVTFADSDDFAESNWLSDLIGIADNNECDLIVEGLIIDYHYKVKKIRIENEKYTPNRIFDAYKILKKNHIEGFLFNKLYKKSIIDTNHLEFKYNLKEDLLFNLYYLYYSSSVITISASSYHYVQHGPQSLRYRRYPADYMKSLITEIHDASIKLCDRFSENNFRKKVMEEYILSYSVILFSMYKRKIGIKKKTDRMEYIQEYQQIREAHQNIKICMGSKTKQMFASFMMLPPKLTDYILSTIKYAWFYE